jgi:hypothetical protein
MKKIIARYIFVIAHYMERAKRYRALKYFISTALITAFLFLNIQSILLLLFNRNYVRFLADKSYFDTVFFAILCSLMILTFNKDYLERLRFSEKELKINLMRLISYMVASVALFIIAKSIMPYFY